MSASGGTGDARLRALLEKWRTDAAEDEATGFAAEDKNNLISATSLLASASELRECANELESALGAVGHAASPKANRFDCVTCGGGIAVDEDGCCRSCGADAMPVQGGHAASPSRLEVIDEAGRQFTRWGCSIELSYQDGGRTLKVFVKDNPDAPKRPEPGWLGPVLDGALEKVRASHAVTSTQDGKS